MHEGMDWANDVCKKNVDKGNMEDYQCIFCFGDDVWRMEISKVYAY